MRVQSPAIGFGCNSNRSRHGPLSTPDLIDSSQDSRRFGFANNSGQGVEIQRAVGY